MDKSDSQSSTGKLLSDLWRRRKGLAAFAFLFAAVAGASFVVSLPSLYQATGTVLVRHGEAFDGSDKGDGGNKISSDLNALQHQVLSRRQLQSLIDRFDLYPDLRQLSSEAVVERMRKDITFQRQDVKEAWGRQVVAAYTIGYQAWDPETAAQVANALADAFVKQSQKMRRRQAKESVGIWEQELGQVRAKLDKEEEEIAVFKSKHADELMEQQNASLATLERLNAQMHINSQNQLRLAKRRDELLNKLSDAKGPRLEELKQRLANLRSQFSEKYPDIIWLKAQIEALKNGKHLDGTAEAEGSGGPSARGQLARVNRRLRSLDKDQDRIRAQIQDYQKHVEDMPETEQKLAQLKRGYEATRETYASLLKRYQTAKAALASRDNMGSQLRVLDPAIPSDTPAGPARLRLLVMVATLSLVFSAAVVFLAEQRDSTFHSVDDLRGFTQVAVVGQIPDIVTISERMRGIGRAAVTAAVALIVLLAIMKLGYAVGQGNQQVAWLLSTHGA